MTFQTYKSYPPMENSGCICGQGGWCAPPHHGRTYAVGANVRRCAHFRTHGAAERAIHLDSRRFMCSPTLDVPSALNPYEGEFGLTRTKA